MRRLVLKTITVLLIFSVCNLVPSTGQCSLTCTEPTFAACSSGEPHMYTVEGAARVRVGGAERDVTLRAEVLVRAPSECELELTVHALLVSGPRGETYSNPLDLEKPLRFKQWTNAVAPDICENGHSRSSLDLKRAIITLLPQQAVNEINNNSNQLNSQTQAALRLLETWDNKIPLTNEYKDVVLVLGNTGAGKSTFTQWIAGHDSELEAIEVMRGEYIIVDNSTRIGDSTINSKTIFPELVVDRNTKTAYYDYPGFSDTRSSSIDMATSYFIKKVIDSTENIKLVFVIGYPSVRKGVDRQDLLKLLRHSSELIKDVNKYKNSIAIIVSKVDNQYVKEGKTFVLVDDDTVVSSIGKFLKEVKHDLSERIKILDIPSKEVKFYNNAIKFIDVLLLQNNGHYRNIGIFRRPDEAGKLHDISLLQEGKEPVSKMIREKLLYTRRDISDFGHTISDKSKNDINELVQEINKRVLFNICDIARKVLDFYQHIVRQVDNNINSSNITAPYSTINVDTNITNESVPKLISIYKGVNKIEHQTKSEKSPVELHELIYNNTLDFGMRIPSESLSNILKEGHYLQYFQNVSDTKFNMRINSLAWASPFENVATYIAKENNRIQTAMDIKIKLEITSLAAKLKSHFTEKEENYHDIQKIYDELNADFTNLSIIQTNSKNMESTQYTKLILNFIANIQIHTNLSNNTLLSINSSNIYFKFLKDAVFNVTSYVKNSKEWYKFLLDLFEDLSEYEVQKHISKCKDYFKKLKNVEENKKVADTNLEEFLNQCYNKGFKFSSDSIKQITLDRAKIRALKETFSFTLGTEFFSCEADDTLVITGQYIVLSEVINKSCGKPRKNIKIFALNKVFVDTDLDKTGEMLQISIIAPTLDIRGHKVNIILDGLPGSAYSPLKASNGIYPGTKGDDGKPGMPGISGGFFLGIGDSVKNPEILSISANGGNGGPGQHGGDGTNGSDGTIPYAPDPLEYLKSKGIYYNGYITHKVIKCVPKACGPDYFYEWNIYGANCSNGGDGGKGGRGGIGGYAGIIKFITLTGGVVSNISNKPGKDGKNGLMGSVGEPGNSGKVLQIIQHFILWSMDFKTTSTTFPSCVRGKTEPTFNEKSIVLPDKINVVHQSHIINDFKKYLRENLYNSIAETSLRKFNDKLDQNPTVENLYDLPGFINELYGLESQFYNLHDEISLVPFYYSLYHRICKYDEKVKSQHDYLDHKRTLNILRVAILSKIYKVSHLDNYQVINIREFFTLVETHIIQYKKALKEVQINTFEEEYQRTIVTQITETNKQILHNILPEIDKIYDKTDNQITLLVQDVIAQQSNKEIEKKELVKKQNELEAQMSLRVLLGVFKFGSQFLAAAGPAGVLASGLVQNGADYFENTLSDYNTPTILSLANTSLMQIMNYYDNEQKYLNRTLHITLNSKVKINQGELQTVLKKIEPLQKLLNSNKSEDARVYLDEKIRTKKELQQYHDELLKQKETILYATPAINFTNVKDEPRHRQHLNKINNIESKIYLVSLIQKAIIVAEVGYDSVKKVNNNQNLIYSLGNDIKRMNNEIDELKKYEQTIYQAIIPMMNKLKSTLQEVGVTSSGKRHASLDITKWKIQSTIKEFKMHMQYRIQVSNSIIKSQFMSFLDNLQTGMLTLIQVYDRIQDYQDKVRFANYIAHLNSEVITTDNKIYLSDIDKLELITKSNLVLQEYEKATEAFKQYMFPFAGFYLYQLELSPNHTSANVNDLINNAIAQLRFLKDELTKDATVIKKKSFHIFPLINFDKSNIERSPFMVWNHTIYKDEISGLLKGKEISIKADIHKGINQNAIKFNEIGINFNLVNQTLQSELNTHLSNFLVDMTHRGDSHYKCDDKFFVITQDRFNMRHSVTRNKDQHYYHLDTTSTVIKDNPSMHSPYTTWKIKLINKEIQQDNFKTLNKYTDQLIDLSLEGWGSYVEMGLDVCNDNLKKYYTEVNHADIETM